MEDAKALCVNNRILFMVFS